MTCDVELHIYIFFLYFLTDMVAVVNGILQQEMSINLYMFHGGTNFGFMNGAAAVGLPAPKPMVTSYGRDGFNASQFLKYVFLHAW